MSSRPRIEPLENRTLLSLDLLGRWAGSSAFSDGWVVDNLAFVGHYGLRAGIHVIDVSDPSNPTQISQFLSPNTTNDYRDIEVQWQLVNDEWRLIGYASGDGSESADRQNGVVVIDFTDPYNPVQLFKITSDHGGTNTVHTLSIEGNLLFEADSRTPVIRAFDISDPSNPRFLRTIRSTVDSTIHEVTLQWGYLVTAGIFGTSSAEIFDVSRILEPGHPVQFLGAVLEHQGLGVRNHTSWFSDDFQFMATARETAGGSLAFWFIGNLPATPIKLWDIALPTNEAFSVHQVMIRGNYLFVSWYQAGIYVYDISNPWSPVLAGSYDTFPGGVGGFDGAWGVYNYWGSNLVYGFDIQYGMFIFQLNPGNSPGPGVGGNLEGFTSRAVRGRWAEGRGVESFLPEQVARVEGDTLTLTLGAGDDTVYVTRGSNGSIIDVTINGTMSFRFDASQLRRLNVRALEGNDRIVLDPDLGLELFIDGGPGDDLVEGWREDYVNALALHQGNTHGRKLNPYLATTVERTTAARTGEATAPSRALDYSAHGLVSHTGGTMTLSGGVGATAMRDHSSGSSVVLVAAASFSSSMIHASVAMPEKGDHQFQGIRTQVVYHKPYCY